MISKMVSNGWGGIYEGPQFPPHGGYPGKFADEGI